MKQIYIDHLLLRLVLFSYSNRWYEYPAEEIYRSMKKCEYLPSAILSHVNRNLLYSFIEENIISIIDKMKPLTIDINIEDLELIFDRGYCQ